MLRDGPELPAQVATLDELLLIVKRDSGLRFDPELGFHLYGADICLQAIEQGLAVVALARTVIVIAQRWIAGSVFRSRLKYSPGNGGTGCRSPHRVRSSTAEELCMS